MGQGLEVPVEPWGLLGGAANHWECVGVGWFIRAGCNMGVG